MVAAGSMTILVCEGLSLWEAVDDHGHVSEVVQGQGLHAS